MKLQDIENKTIVCIFAHPDDETFGPAGTIHKLSKNNTIFVICATDGDAGENMSKVTGKTTGQIRTDELYASAKLLGVKKVFMLNFKDGTLSNNMYHTILEEIQPILNELKPDVLMTYEPRGISGHIDHVAMSHITSYLFEKNDSVQYLLFYCIDEEHRAPIQNYFIHFPPGYKDSEIDMKVSIEDVWEKKVEAMRLHESQKKDCENILRRNKNLPKVECFLVRKK